MFISICTHAQDMDDIRQYLSKNQFTEAKKAIDAMIQNPKQAKDAEVWYYKGVINNACSKDKDVSGEDAMKNRQEAFDAFRKCQQLDKSDKLMKLEMYESYYDLYAGAFNLGVTEYNKKNYPLSMHSFMLTVSINDYIQQKEYTFNGVQLAKLDTSLHVNIIVTALQSDSIDIAIAYFKKLADAGIRTKDVRDVSEDLLSYGLKKGNDQMFESLLGMAGKLFPEEEIWLDYELKFYENKNDKAILHKKYEELIDKHPNNFTIVYNYAVELYNEIHTGEQAKTNDVVMNEKFMNYIQKSIQNEGKKDVMARLLLNRHLFNVYNDQEKSMKDIKGNKPQDLQAKNKIKQEIDKVSAQFITNSESALSFLDGVSNKTSVQKANQKLVIQMLIEIYSDQKNTQKVSYYEKLETALDKQ